MVVATPKPREAMAPAPTGSFRGSFDPAAKRTARGPPVATVVLVVVVTAVDPSDDDRALRDCFDGGVTVGGCVTGTAGTNNAGEP